MMYMLGVGKSIVVFLYAIWASQYRRVIFIHGDERGYKVSYGSIGHFTTSYMIKSIQRVADWAECNIRQGDLVIVDGTNADLIASIRMDCAKASVKLIVCTSFKAVKLRSETMRVLPISLFTMDSWCYEEYVDAAHKGVFPFPIDRLEELYYYAGGGIRYMYWPIDRIIRHLDTAIAEVSDISAILQGQVGDTSMSAVNSLMSITYNTASQRTESTVISEYATIALPLKGDELASFISTVRLCDRLNPLWLDWVTKLDVISRVRALAIGDSIDMYTTYGFDKHYTACYPTLDLPPNTLQDQLPHDSIRPGTFIIPNRWNHGTFDLAYLHEEGPSRRRVRHTRTVTLFQVTEQTEYNRYNLTSIHDFMTQFGAKYVEYVIICRKWMIPVISYSSPPKQILVQWEQLMNNIYTNTTDIKPVLTVNKMVYDLTRDE